MDANGNIKYMEYVKNLKVMEGFLPVKEEYEAQVGMMLKGDRVGKINLSLFTKYTKGSAKKRRELIKKAMKRKEK